MANFVRYHNPSIKEPTTSGYQNPIPKNDGKVNKMKTLVQPKTLTGLPYNKTEYTLLSIPGCRNGFIQAAAIFFIQSWMSAALPEMLNVWQHWDNASDADKQYYIQHLYHLFSNGTLIDDPDGHHSAPHSRHTIPIGTFSETMLRWLRLSFEPAPLLVEPIAPMPTDDGKIDLVEITGLPGNYYSMRVTLWEVKSSDSQVHNHNSKIYNQLEAYPERFFNLANCLCSSYTGDDTAFRTFLKNMGRMARNRQPQVHYGVFITYDSNVVQKVSATPNLHKHPADHPSQPGEVCHHLALLLIPNFKQLRLEVWRYLHLI